MNDPAPPHDYAAWIRDYANLVNRVLAQGPKVVADEIAERTFERADGSFPAEGLRSLLLSHAHMLVHAQGQDELACLLHDLLVRRPSLSDRLIGVERALPSPRLAVRGPERTPDESRLIRVLTEHDAPVSSVAWSPEGDRLATVGDYGTTVRIWNRRDWRQERVLDIPASLDQALWSPDGRRLAVLGKSDRFPDLGKTEPDDLHGWESHIEHVRMILVYDTLTWQEIAATPTAPRLWWGDRPTIAWSPESRTLAIGEDIGVRLWDFEAERQPPWLGPLLDVRRVLDLDWHPNGALTALVEKERPMAAGKPSSPEAMLATWSAPRTTPERCTWNTEVPGAFYSGLSRRPDGERICVYTRSGLSLWDPVGGRMLWRRDPGGFQGPRTQTVSWSPEGRRLAELCSRHQGWSHIVLWDLGEAEEPSVSDRIDCAPEETTALAWSPAGDLLATGGASGVRLWAPETDESRPCGFDTWVTTPVWSPDSAHVAVFCPERKVWSVVDARDPTEPTPVGEECPFPRRDPEAERNLIEEVRREGGGHDRYVSMYDSHVPEALSPGWEWYALAGTGAPITLFDLDNGGSRKLSEDEEPGWWALLCFTPDSDRLVSARYRTFRTQGSTDLWEEVVLSLWDVATGRRLARERIRGDREAGERLHDRPRDIAVSRTHVAWIGHHGVIALHDLRTLNPLCRNRITAGTTQVEFSPDGNALAVVGDLGVHVVDLIGVHT